MASFVTRPDGQGNTLGIHTPPAMKQAAGGFPLDSEIIYCSIISEIELNNQFIYTLVNNFILVQDELGKMYCYFRG